jgi:hypothetical protein
MWSIRNDGKICEMHSLQIISICRKQCTFFFDGEELDIDETPESLGKIDFAFFDPPLTDRQILVAISFIRSNYVKWFDSSRIERFPDMGLSKCRLYRNAQNCCVRRL